MSRSKSSQAEPGPELLLSDTLDTMHRTVCAQVAGCARAFLRRDAKSARAVKVKDGYVDNLNTQSQLFSQELNVAGNSRLARYGWTTAVNLEHIGDYAVNVAQQHVHRVLDTPPEGTNSLLDYAELVLEGMAKAKRAFERRDLDEAFAACKIEEELDRLYAADLSRLLKVMESGSDAARDAVTWAFAFKNMERMGDVVLNLGEAVLALLCGERMKLEHLRNIEALVPASQIRARGMWGGVSGAFIALVQRNDDTFVYKGGPHEKILSEYANLKRWEEISPGTTAVIHEPPPTAQDAPDPVGMLLEHINGPTLEDFVLRTREPIDPALRKLFALMKSVWAQTRSQRSEPTGFVRQIRARLRQLFDVHPSFARLRAQRRRFGDLEFPALDEMLDAAERAEAKLLPPGRMFLHGDLNLNNVILEGRGRDRRIRLVDVGRSRRGDMAEDVSVLMVSCVRHPLASGPAQVRARFAYDRVRDFATALALIQGDSDFPRRLALGLARSFITSGRVLRDSNLARALFLKGILYLEEFLCLRSQ